VTGWREVTQADLDGFASVSGDDNPIHTDAGYAASTPFEVPVAHGMFLFSLVRAELRRRWPAGRMAEQRLVFPSPTPVGARVRVLLEEGGDEGGLLAVTTRVESEWGTAGLTGRCLLDLSGGDPLASAELPTSGAKSQTQADAGGGAGWWDGAVGRTHIQSRVFSDGDLAAYEELVDDHVPEGTVPEPLVAGLFSTVLGVHLPGPGTNYLKQELQFGSTPRPDEVLTATVEVVRVVPHKRLVYLATTCSGGSGRLVAQGQALVLAAGIPTG
jgi:acyl dehydratase